MRTLSNEVVQKLITEGFKPFPKNQPVILFCNKVAFGKITGYRERNNSLTGEFIAAYQPSMPKMNYSYQKALHTVIYKARISIQSGKVYFTKRDEMPLEGIEAELAYEGKGEFQGVERVLLNHIAALERSFFRSHSDLLHKQKGPNLNE